MPVFLSDVWYFEPRLLTEINDTAIEIWTQGFDRLIDINEWLVMDFLDREEQYIYPFMYSSH